MKRIAGQDLKRGTFVYCPNVPDENGVSKVSPAPDLTTAWPFNSIGFTLDMDYKEGDEVAFPQFFGLNQKQKE